MWMATRHLPTCPLQGHYQRLPDCEIYINQTITTGTGTNRVRLKPDLVVVQNKIIFALLDLKMDLGYKRDTIPEFWDSYDKYILNLRGEEFSLHRKEGENKERIFLHCSSRFAK